VFLVIRRKKKKEMLSDDVDEASVRPPLIHGQFPIEVDLDDHEYENPMAETQIGDMDGFAETQTMTLLGDGEGSDRG
jgi:hypothetical protein